METELKSEQGVEEGLAEGVSEQKSEAEKVSSGTKKLGGSISRCNAVTTVKLKEAPKV